jgi:hypothetical protein
MKVDVHIRSQNTNQNTPMESVKILSPDGLTLHHRMMVGTEFVNGGWVAEATTTNRQLTIEGTFTVPDDVTEIRFQVDQCTRITSDALRTTMTWIDGCVLREVEE